MSTSIPFVATYRLELTSDFDFGDAANIVELLNEIGISHLSLSPFNYRDQSKGFDQLMKMVALQKPAMRVIVDAVPPAPLPSTEDAAFADILKAGPHSVHLTDLGIELPERRGAPLVTLPILRSKPATALSAGDFRLCFDLRFGFYIRYHDYRVPLAHNSISRIIHRFLDAIASSHYFAKKELAELSSYIQTLEREQIRRYPRFAEPIDKIYGWFAKSHLRIGQLREFLQSAPMLFVSDILRHQYFALETPLSGLNELFAKYQMLQGIRLENIYDDAAYSHITPNLFVIGNDVRDPALIQGFRYLNAVTTPQPYLSERDTSESLSRIAIGICAPGVPLFCTDSKVKADYEEQREFLDEIRFNAERPRSDLMSWLGTQSSALVMQLWTIRELLKLRREHLELFDMGEHIPLGSDGLAFARRHQRKWIIMSNDSNILLPVEAPTHFWNYLEQKPVEVMDRRLKLERQNMSLPWILTSFKKL